MAGTRISRFVGHDGVELSYRDLGEGRPLVLLHGFTASAGQWLDHGPGRVLAERGYRLILPDLRGHGDSARPHDPARYPPDVLADDGLALIDQLGLDDYDLGGYSLGAQVALRMLVRGATPARAVLGGLGLSALGGNAVGGTNFRVLTALADGDTLVPGSPEAEAAHWITQLGGDPRALLCVLGSLVPTPQPQIRRLTVPTLVAVGDRDDARASAEAMAALLPAARFALVPGDHWSALTTPRFGDIMLEFLGEGLL